MKPKGFDNENEIVEALDKKRFKRLNLIWKDIIKSIFPDVSDNDRLKCTLTDNFIKPDIVVSCGGQDAYISIKSPNTTLFHGEDIKSFILFLRHLGISESTQKVILYYQYGDKTLDGSGEKRMGYNEVYEWLKDYIKAANEELNKTNDIIEAILDRILFQGVDQCAPRADYIYVGNIKEGTLLSRTQILRHLKHKNWLYYDNLHIGPIFLRPHARYANRQIVDERRRNQIFCSWARFEDDVIYINKNYRL